MLPVVLRWQPQTLPHTFDELKVVGDLLQDGEAGQDQAIRAAQPPPRAAIRLVPLATLRKSVLPYWANIKAKSCPTCRS